MPSSNRQNLPAATGICIASIAAAAAAVSLVHLVKRRRQRIANETCSLLWSSFRYNRHSKGSEVVALYNNSQIRAEGAEPAYSYVYVITGATRGLGLCTSRLIATLPNAHVILGCRDTVAGCNLADDINNKLSHSTSKAECIHLDLSSFASVKSFANDVVDICNKLGGTAAIRALVNNAGTYALSGSTRDGFQTTFQTNTLSHALLTELLLPWMANDSRVINVSSEMMAMIWNRTTAPNRPFPPVNGGGSEWDYALSKACQGLHAHELNLRFASDGSTRRRAFAIEPGIVITDISRNLSPWTQRINYFFFAPLLSTIDEGTATTLFCVLAPEEELDKGKVKVGNTNSGSDAINPFLYAHCAPRAPHRCCRRAEDALAQAETFRKIFEDRSLL